MSRLCKLLWWRDDTQPWKGAYAPYDLVKELCIAVGVVALLTVLLTVLFSSPNEKPNTLEQWAKQKPVDFLTAAATELDGKSGTAGYGPPYNENGEGQHAWFLRPQKWLGVSHPINTAYDYVISPLNVESSEAEYTVRAAVAAYKAAPAKTQLGWAEAYEKALEKASAAPDGSVAVPAGEYGPVGLMMKELLNLGQSGDLDGDLITTGRFFQTDYTNALLFMADGGLLSERAEKEHLLGDQWGMMNETGSYPGQAWLWLYAFWYQIEPFKNSENADILVMIIMTVLSIAFVCVPLIPGVRDLPRWVPIHRLIWKEHYRARQSIRR